MVWGRDLPLSEWGEEFADKLPTPIMHALRKARGEQRGSIDDETWKEVLAQRFGPLLESASATGRNRRARNKVVARQFSNSVRPRARRRQNRHLPSRIAHTRR